MRSRPCTRRSAQLLAARRPAAASTGARSSTPSPRPPCARPSGPRTRGAPGAVEVSLLFCDLKDFTAFTDVRRRRGRGRRRSTASPRRHERARRATFTLHEGARRRLHARRSRARTSAVRACCRDHRAHARGRLCPASTRSVHRGVAIVPRGRLLRRLGQPRCPAAGRRRPRRARRLAQPGRSPATGRVSFDWQACDTTPIRGASRPVEYSTACASARRRTETRREAGDGEPTGRGSMAAGQRTSEQSASNDVGGRAAWEDLDPGHHRRRPSVKDLFPVAGLSRH